MLRPWTEKDVDSLHLLWTGAEVRRYLWDDRIVTREHTERTVLSAIAAGRQRGIGQWTVHEEDSSVLSGFCGFRVAEDTGEIGLLYGLTPARWHRGLATEAAGEVLRYAFGEGCVEYVSARTSERNAASVWVMRRLGMVFDGRVECENGPVVCYSLTRHAFERRRLVVVGHAQRVPVACPDRKIADDRKRSPAPPGTPITDPAL